MLIVACDPGVSGAFAALTNESLVYFSDIPTLRDHNNRRIPARDLIISTLRGYQLLGAELFVIEHVWGYEGQGAGAAFNFGHGCGGIEYAAATLGYRVEKVAAQTWKSALKVSADKKKAIARATELFPAYANLWAEVRGNGDVAQRSGRAEAALLALYAHQVFGNQGQGD